MLHRIGVLKIGITTPQAIDQLTLGRVNRQINDHQTRTIGHLQVEAHLFLNQDQLEDHLDNNEVPFSSFTSCCELRGFHTRCF